MRPKQAVKQRIKIVNLKRRGVAEAGLGPTRGEDGTDRHLVVDTNTEIDRRRGEDIGDRELEAEAILGHLRGGIGEDMMITMIEKFRVDARVRALARPSLKGITLNRVDTELTSRVVGL